jgi:hypothetical protein
VGGVELGAVWEVLASKAYGRKQAARIDMARAMTEVDAGTPLEQATAVNTGVGDTIYAVRPPPPPAHPLPPQAYCRHRITRALQCTLERLPGG